MVSQLAGRCDQPLSRGVSPQSWSISLVAAHEFLVRSSGTRVSDFKRWKEWVGNSRGFRSA